MSILLEDCYKKRKTESAIAIIASAMIALVWSHFDFFFPFLAAKIETTISYPLKIMLTSIIIFASLGSYIFLLIRKHKKEKTKLEKVIAELTLRIENPLLYYYTRPFDPNKKK